MKDQSQENLKNKAADKQDAAQENLSNSFQENEQIRPAEQDDSTEQSFDKFDSEAAQQNFGDVDPPKTINELYAKSEVEEGEKVTEVEKGEESPLLENYGDQGVTEVEESSSLNSFDDQREEQPAKSINEWYSMPSDDELAKTPGEWEAPKFRELDQQIYKVEASEDFGDEEVEEVTEVENGKEPILSEDYEEQRVPYTVEQFSGITNYTAQNEDDTDEEDVQVPLSINDRYAESESPSFENYGDQGVKKVEGVKQGQSATSSFGGIYTPPEDYEPVTAEENSQPVSTTINQAYAQAQEEKTTASSPATPPAQPKPQKSWFKRFFLFCSGVDQELLEKCPGDENKFIGIGGTVFFTGVLAFLSAGYAIQTVFDNVLMAVFFGVIWGLMIFNLDRYIVSSMKKQGSWWKDFGMAMPRLLMAILLALVISKPLELKIFEKEINAELITMEQEVYAEQEGKVKARFESQITAYQDDNKAMEAELATLRYKRDTLEMMAIQEADGTGGSGKRNLGPIYRAKKAEADQAGQELKATEASMLPLIAENRLAVQDLQKQLQEEINELERSAYGGMAARMEALHRLGQDSDAIWWASLMIMLLFVAVETAPIMVKLISTRSPYDYLLLQQEHSVETVTKEKVTIANNELKNKIQFDTETNLYRTEQEIELEKEMIDYYLQRRRDALKTYAVDWKKPFIHSEIKESQAKIDVNEYYKPHNSQRNSINDVYAESA